MISPRQGLVLVVGIFAIAATLSTMQRRSARMITAQTQAANAALDYGAYFLPRRLVPLLQ
jgi:hypothetical protein